MGGLELFEDCLRHPEPLIDDAYCQDALIISTGPEQRPTRVMEANSALLERITAFKLAVTDGDRVAAARHLSQIALLVETPDMNFVEFTGFWPSLDVSYSTYGQLQPAEKLAFLEKALLQYIQKRHDLFRAHGYTATTIQVRRDFESHKRRGNAAVAKLRKLLEAASYAVAPSIGTLVSRPMTYGFFGTAGFQRPDLIRLIEGLRVPFRWHLDHQNKLPDFVLHHESGRIFIGEAKHMKESGGGQDKQVTELIALVSQDEIGERAGYVGYLDGIYFNSLADPARAGAKAREKVGQIRSALATQPNNYFVNTHGFRALIGLPVPGRSASAPEGASADALRG